MAGVPFVFGNATTSIPLSNLDANFNTGLTIGNTTVGLGNTVTTLGNVSLTNVNIVSGTVPVPTSIANGTSNVFISSSGGNINVTTAGTTATFPQATGTVMVSGNQPAFDAYRSSTPQTFSASTNTKVQFNSEVYDTANCFDSTTNYRFTPTVAGYYQLNFSISMYVTSGASTMTVAFINVFKNGSNPGGLGTGGQYQHGTYAAVDTWQTNNTCLVYANGITDYFEVYVYSNSVNSAVDTGSSFTGVLVRGA